MTSQQSRRVLRHLALFTAAGLLTGIAFLATPPPDLRHRLSLATAYAGLAFLAACLALGPWMVVTRRPPPASFDLRRDIGIWSGVLALAHLAVGLTVHLRGRMWMYFLKDLHPPALQANLFGFANFTGLAAGLIFVMLLAISNNASLRALGLGRWKSLQRWSYGAAALTLAHGIAYCVVENRTLPWQLVFGLLSITALALQLAAFARRRDQSSKG